METAYGDVLRLIEKARKGGELLRWWQGKYSTGLQRYVTGFRHRALYDVTPNDVLTVIEESSHALGLIPKEADIPTTRDAHIEYAIEYLFHGLLEHLGRVPTWDEFWYDMRGPRSKWWFDLMLGLCRERGIEEKAALHGIQWRLGIAWQSSIREVHLISCLRHRHRVNVKYHILADVLFRTDGWLGNRLIYLRVPNSLENRKTDPAEIFPTPAYRVHRVSVEHQGFGKVWLAPEEEASGAAAFLRAGEVRSRGEVGLRAKRVAADNDGENAVGR